MKKIILLLLLLVTWKVKAQNSGTITVGGDFDKFYPTVWTDGGWDNNATSVLEIGRSLVHTNSDWRGSLLARFEFHLNRYGNASDFINADIVQNYKHLGTQNVDFIAGWADQTLSNPGYGMVIWLRGGGTSYHYNSKYTTSCVVYDGVANPLPYQEYNGTIRTYKTMTDDYVNSNGLSRTGTAYFNGTGASYFAGNLGLGTPDTKGYKLAVNGKVRAHEIKVETANWPDYVFAKEYSLPSLNETEKHIQEKGHLPGIPSAAEVKSNGVDLGAMNAKLLQKIEELTLHQIRQEKEMTELRKQVKELKKSN